jgi:hypothetical protein
MNLAKAWFFVDNKHTWDHVVDASISAMKYLNDPVDGCIGPQISPGMRSKNCSGSAFILR